MRARPLLVCLAAGLLVAGACGDDADPPDDEPDAVSGAGDDTGTGEDTEDDAAGEEAGARPSAGCGQPTPAAPGTERVELASQGFDWWYLRNVPPVHDGTTPVPLVVDFHGYSEGAEIHVQHSALDVFGDAHGFVSVFPHAQGEVPFWNAELGAAESAYFADLRDQLEADLCLDLDRLHVTGLSNGAFMTSLVACAHADRVASVAPVAGIRDIEGCDPVRPVPVVAFHGTDDGFVAYDGGLGDDAADLPAPDGSGQTLDEIGVIDAEAGNTSVPEITAAWAERNGCGDEPRETELAHDVTVVAFDCPEGATTELYRIEGGGHSWPGSEFSAVIEDIVGPTTTSIWANEAMWEFFEQHPLR
jgi:polyhydroxybutyrate depolymerase